MRAIKILALSLSLTFAVVAIYVAGAASAQIPLIGTIVYVRSCAGEITHVLTQADGMAGIHTVHNMTQREIWSMNHLLIQMYASGVDDVVLDLRKLLGGKCA